jgi:hypothetical protein
MAKEVKVLEKGRNEYLLTNEIGRPSFPPTTSIVLP